MREDAGQQRLVRRGKVDGIADVKLLGLDGLLG